jgi:hypothetical protein
MKKNELYIVVQWPESQEFIGDEDCFLINDELGVDLFGSSAYFVRLDIYEKFYGEVTINN